MSNKFFKLLPGDMLYYGPYDGCDPSTDVQQTFSQTVVVIIVSERAAAYTILEESLGFMNHPASLLVDNSSTGYEYNVVFKMQYTGYIYLGPRKGYVGKRITFYEEDA